MADITPEGFVPKTENEYFDDEIELYQSIDPDWNLDASSPDGLKAASDAEVFVNLDEAAQAAYNSKDPNKARDLELNIVSSITGVKRDDGSPSTISNVTMTGVNGTIIPAGSTIQSSFDETQWVTDAEVTITGGVGSTTVTAVDNGATAADIDTITVIVDSVGGWQTVTNTVVAALGKDRETNAALRLRREITVGRPGNNQIDSMLGELGAVDNIGRFKIYENDTNATDANGLPAHSIAVLAEGGTDADVALAIYVKKNPGVFLHPASTPVVVNVQSPVHPTNTKDITFSRPVGDPMTVVVAITNDGTLVASTEQDVKDSILEYINGTLIPADEGFNPNGFDIGENVGVSRVYTPVNNVIGALGNSFITTLTVNGVSTTVTVAFNALSTWTDANISVVIT